MSNIITPDADEGVHEPNKSRVSSNVTIFDIGE
jgi:hypothetical protein